MSDYYLKGQEAGYRDGQVYLDCVDHEAYLEFRKGYLSGYKAALKVLEAEVAGLREADSYEE